MTESPRALPPPLSGLHGWPWDDPSATAPPRAPRDDDPLIGLVVPSYNQGEFLEATLRSALQQAYPRLALVVMDGGSSDGSLEIIRRYAPWLTAWSSQPDGGQSDAINRGLAQLQFRIGGWLNSDDMLLPGALFAIADYVRMNPACEWLTGDGVFTGPDGRTEQFVQRGAAHSREALLDYARGCYLPQPSVFFSKQLFDRAGRLDDRLRYSMDLDLWLRMRALAPLHYLPMALSILRQHDGAKTVRDNERAMAEVEATVRRHARDTPLRTRLSVGWHLRELRAQSACRTALAAHFASDRAETWHALMRAVTLAPTIIGSRPFLRAGLRATLPRTVRRRLFARP